MYPSRTQLPELLPQPVLAGVIGGICFLSVAVIFSTTAACIMNRRRAARLRKRRQGTSRGGDKGQAGWVGTEWVPPSPPHHVLSCSPCDSPPVFSWPSRSTTRLLPQQEAPTSTVSHTPRHCLALSLSHVTAMLPPSHSLPVLLPPCHIPFLSCHVPLLPCHAPPHPIPSLSHSCHVTPLLLLPHILLPLLPPLLAMPCSYPCPSASHCTPRHPSATGWGHRDRLPLTEGARCQVLGPGLPPHAPSGQFWLEKGSESAGAGL